jgi:putative membrane protein
MNTAAINPAAGQPIWIPYCGAAPVPGEWLGRWNFDPLLLAVIGAIALASHLAIGRAEPGRRFALAAALAVLLLLFVSPLCALASALFSARVVHHVLFTAVAAPLLVLALPRRRLAMAGPLAFWTLLSAMVFWAWHAPAVYAFALSSDAAYWLMQLTLLASATGYWAALRRSSAPAAVAALLAAMVQMGLLGALITFSGAPSYAPHFATTRPWGLDPLEDQQLGGLIMWAPAAGLYLAAALLLASRWLGRESRAAAG